MDSVSDICKYHLLCFVTIIEVQAILGHQVKKNTQNDVKSACFLHVLCHISAFLEDFDFKFCAHIYQSLPSNICTVF